MFQAFKVDSLDEIRALWPSAAGLIFLLLNIVLNAIASML